MTIVKIYNGKSKNLQVRNILSQCDEISGDTNFCLRIIIKDMVIYIIPDMLYSISCDVFRVCELYIAFLPQLLP